MSTVRTKHATILTANNVCPVEKLRYDLVLVTLRGALFGRVRVVLNYASWTSRMYTTIGTANGRRPDERYHTTWVFH